MSILIKLDQKITTPIFRQIIEEGIKRLAAGLSELYDQQSRYSVPPFEIKGG